MKNFRKSIILVVGILAVTFVVITLLQKFKPEAKTVESLRAPRPVEVMSVARTDEDIKITAQGVIEAETITNLASEVVGKVADIDDRFEIGGEIPENETILLIDSSDYAAALSQAKVSPQHFSNETVPHLWPRSTRQCE